MCEVLRIATAGTRRSFTNYTFKEFVLRVPSSQLQVSDHFFNTASQLDATSQLHGLLSKLRDIDLDTHILTMTTWRSFPEHLGSRRTVQPKTGRTKLTRRAFPDLKLEAWTVSKRFFSRNVFMNRSSIHPSPQICHLCFVQGFVAEQESTLRA
jgi:hypothetical protein